MAIPEFENWEIEKFKDNIEKIIITNQNITEFESISGGRVPKREWINYMINMEICSIITVRMHNFEKEYTKDISSVDHLKLSKISNECLKKEQYIDDDWYNERQKEQNDDNYYKNLISYEDFYGNDKPNLKVQFDNQSIVKNTTYVYIIIGGKLVKIGKANNPKERIKSLQIGSPVPLELIFYSSNFSEEELQLKFRPYLHYHEWYIYSDEIKMFIEKNQNYNLINKMRDE